MNFKIDKNIDYKKIDELSKKMIEDIRLKSKEDCKNHLVFLRKYAEDGWFFDVGGLPIGFITANVDSSICDENNICDYVERIAGEMDTSIFYRGELISTAIKLHNDNNYCASIPLLLLNIEGELRDILDGENGFPFSNKNVKIVKGKELQRYIIKIIEEEKIDFFTNPKTRKFRDIFLKNICNEWNFYGVGIQKILEIKFPSIRDVGVCKRICEKCKRRNKFNRDIVLHGSCPKYGNRINSAKAMSLLFLVKAIASFRDHIREDAQEFEKDLEEYYN